MNGFRSTARVLLAALVVWRIAGYAIAASPPGPLVEGDSRYQARTDKVDMMIIHAHADDEGLYYGGTLPYYAHIRHWNVIDVIMCSGFMEDRSIVNSSATQLFDGDPNHKHYHLTREAELRQVMWDCGFATEPVYARFPANNWQLATNYSWATWADPAVGDGDPRSPSAEEIASGMERATEYIATQLRLYRPDVILSHDFGGEYGHPDHKNVAYATADAVIMAADADASLGGLPAWQIKKHYTHLWDRGGSITSTWPLISMIDHDLSDTTFPELNNLTPLQAVNAAMAEHYDSQGNPQSDAYDYADYYGLYSSTVGADTQAVDGLGFSHGGFFQNLTYAPDVLSAGLTHESFESVTTIPQTPFEGVADLTWTGDLGLFEIRDAGWPNALGGVAFSGSRAARMQHIDGNQTLLTGHTVLQSIAASNTEWSVFLSGSTNCSVTDVRREVSLLLLSDSSIPAAVEAGTMNGYRLRLGDDDGDGGDSDALHFERASGAGWATLRKDNLGVHAILGDGWNLRVVRVSNGVWHYGYLVGNPAHPTNVALAFTHSDAIHDTGTHVGVTFHCGDGLRSDEWGFDDFRIRTGLPPVTADGPTSLTIANYSFESDTLGDGAYTTVPTGWTAGSAGAINLNSSQINEGSVDGSNSGWVNPGGSLSQTLGDTFIAGKVYTLSVVVARRIDHVTDVGWAVELAEGSGGTTLASVSNLIPESVPEDGSFINQVMMYTAQPADAGKPIRIVLKGTATQASFDNVRISHEDAPASGGTTVTIVDAANNAGLRGVPGTVFGAGFGTFSSDFRGASGGGFSSYHHWSTPAAGAGRPATWSFHGLPRATYNVHATWPGAANRTTATPFKVYDGTVASGTLRAGGTLNQEHAPNDLSIDDGWGPAAWELLGEVKVDTGMIAVVLESVDNSSDTDYVIADAIRVEALRPKGSLFIVK